MIRTWYRYSPPLGLSGAAVEASQGGSPGLVWILEGTTRTLLTSAQATERYRGWRRELARDQAATDARFGDARIIVAVPSERKSNSRFSSVQGRAPVVDY